jgi:hypothetical protein
MDYGDLLLCHHAGHDRIRAVTASAEFAEAFRQSVDAGGSAHADEVRKMLEEPSGFALMFILGLVGLFLLLTR